jgi:hypothetical protein
MPDSRPVAHQLIKTNTHGNPQVAKRVENCIEFEGGVSPNYHLLKDTLLLLKHSVYDGNIKMGHDDTSQIYPIGGRVVAVVFKKEHYTNPSK